MRLPRPRRRLLAILLVLPVFAIVAGCGPSPTRWAAPVSPSPAHTPGASGSPSPTAAPNPFDGKTPKFDPAPPPEPISLAGGPTAPLLDHIPTTQKVAFLTIDDGWIKKPEAIALLKASGVPVSLFLLSPAAKENPAYFKELVANGAVIEAHTINHLSMPTLGYDRQKQEICGGADELAKTFGTRPTLFRPPFGDYNQNTLRAAHDCGMKAVLYWKQTVDKGKVRYQGEWGKMQPGDIVLMHFREAYADDFTAALNAMKANGLTPALLENYIP
ncbi:polysaccharide deacetylase family protein [Longispora sp. K20-0274]|uniref:polysaccharide deacetylase family protein n=1 Tax=Longispora sp. K20-0274 TaxID=3088255 RepID=UPI00399B65B2